MRPCPTAAALQVALAAVVLVSRGASADDRRPVLRLEYEAPPGCPDAPEFAQQVERRRAHPASAGSEEPSRALRVQIRRAAGPTAGGAPGGVVGRLVVVDPEGRASERTIEGTDCRGVASALALIAALAVDGNGSPPAAAAPAPAASPAPAPPPAPRATSPTRPEPETTAQAPAARPAPAPPPPPSSSRLEPEHTAQPPATRPAPPPRIVNLESDRRSPPGGHVPLSFSAAAEALLAEGMAPEPTLGWTALAGLSIGRPGPAGALLVRVGIASALARTFSGPDGAASFDWIAGVAEACPVSLAVLSTVRVRPCVVGEYGAVHASGSDTMNPQAVMRPWAGAGVEARLSWQVLGPISLDGSISGLAAFERNQFILGSDSVFETPPVVARATLGFGIDTP